ncbi:AmmeMemoRadiSam system protein B, partial [Klebsiella pneumoniae]|uniref:AmmeMemoRadiSam system protein B n=1 Tax=Klebsiella pneumoniae TaxID=573 RepID=UPI003FCFCC01
HVSSVRALIAPHAGISYSGAVAAATYRLIDRHTKQILILAPDHSGTSTGIALPALKQYQLPHSRLMVDNMAIQALAQQPLLQINNNPF